MWPWKPAASWSTTTSRLKLPPRRSSRIHNFSFSISFRLWFAAQAWVCDFVDAVVDEGEARAQQGDAEAGRHEPPPHAQEKRVVLLRPVEQAAPADGGGIAEAEKLQRSFRQDNIKRGADKVGGHNRNLVGENLKKDDAPDAFSAGASSRHKLAAAHRKRLRAQHARSPCPAGEGNHQRDGQRAAREVRGQHDSQRQRGQHQKNVGEQREYLVDDAAEVAADQTDNDGDHRYQKAGQKSPEDGGACPHDELAEDILSQGGRAEQVL